MPLTDTKIRNAKSQDKPVKLVDGQGLYLLLNPNSSRWWRLDYRFGGKRKTLSMGVYPDVSLADARARRDEARKLLANGADPGLKRKAEKLAAMARAENNFEAIAREWHEKRLPTLSAGHAAQIINTLTREVFPVIGHRPISEIEAHELLAALRPIEKRGALEIAGKVRRWCGMIFRYAIATGRAKYNPAPDLRGALATPVTKHHAAFDRAGLRDFLIKLDDFDGTLQTRLALRLLALTFVRTGELRGASWAEIDIPRKTWSIPAERMKMRAPHIVPLSNQSVAILEELRTLNPECDLVFPGANSKSKPISENTLLYALYRMGYHGRATGHGFRATASTILNEEIGWKPDVIERQLAHVEKNKVRAAYHRAEYLSERRAMMQQWADYLDKLKAGAEVIDLRDHAAA